MLISSVLKNSSLFISSWKTRSPKAGGQAAHGMALDYASATRSSHGNNVGSTFVMPYVNKKRRQAIARIVAENIEKGMPPHQAQSLALALTGRREKNEKRSHQSPQRGH